MSNQSRADRGTRDPDRLQGTWPAVIAALPIGSHVTGEVIARHPFGVFIRIDGVPDALGLAEITSMATDAVLPVVGRRVAGEVIWHAEHNHQIKIRLRDDPGTDPAIPGWQDRTILDSPIPRLLQARPAVVLERIARGGGATNWYRCLHHPDLASIAARLVPGSVVSFYFDDRIAHRLYTPRLHQQMLDLMQRLSHVPGETGELVVGQLAADELRINVDYPGSPEDLDEFTRTLGTHSWVYFGRFPGRDNDGTNAVTITLPDLDGIVRAHPH